jgi:integrase
MQTWLNDLAENYSDSIVRHAFVNLRSIMKLAHKLLPENPAEETAMPVTRPVDRQTMTQEQIASLMSAIEDPHDLCLMCIGLFCATRTSETFGLQWRSYRGDRLMIESTAYEGELYRGQVKTKASRNSVPIPDDIIPIVEAWRQLCPDTSAEALMFSTFGRTKRKGQKVPRRAKNFLKWRIYPIADRLKIPRELVTFQVMRRTLGTDLQKHGTMKDAQGALRHASIKTTAGRVHAGNPGERASRNQLANARNFGSARRDFSKSCICNVSKRVQMGRCARVEAVDVGSREMFEAMNKAIQFHVMRPAVDRVFGFSELREALSYLKEARHFGKVCLRA